MWRLTAAALCYILDQDNEDVSQWFMEYYPDNFWYASAMICCTVYDFQRAREVPQVTVRIYGAERRASTKAELLPRRSAHVCGRCHSADLRPACSSPTFPDDWRQCFFAVQDSSKPSFLFFFSLQILPTSGGEHLPEDPQAAVGNEIKRKPWVCVSAATPHWRMCCVAADIAARLCDRGLHQNKCAILVPETIFTEKKQNNVEVTQKAVNKEQKSKEKVAKTLKFIFSQLWY